MVRVVFRGEAMSEWTGRAKAEWIKCAVVTAEASKRDEEERREASASESMPFFNPGAFL